MKITDIHFKIKFRRNFQYLVQNLLINIGGCNSRLKYTNMIYRSWFGILVWESLQNYTFKLYFVTLFDNLGNLDYPLKPLVVKGHGIHILGNEWIQICFLDRRTCYFHSSTFFKILIFIFKRLYNMILQNSFLQRMQVYFISKANFHGSKTWSFKNDFNE
jgi:hypothetical protein